MYTTASLRIPTVLEGTLLQGEVTLDAIVEVAAFRRMRKEVGHVGQTLVCRRILKLKEAGKHDQYGVWNII